LLLNIGRVSDFEADGGGVGDGETASGVVAGASGEAVGLASGVAVGVTAGAVASGVGVGEAASGVAVGTGASGVAVGAAASGVGVGEAASGVAVGAAIPGFTFGVVASGVGVGAASSGVAMGATASGVAVGAGASGLGVGATASGVAVGVGDSGVTVAAAVGAGVAVVTGVAVGVAVDSGVGELADCPPAGAGGCCSHPTTRKVVTARATTKHFFMPVYTDARSEEIFKAGSKGRTFGHNAWFGGFPGSSKAEEVRRDALLTAEVGKPSRLTFRGCGLRSKEAEVDGLCLGGSGKPRFTLRKLVIASCPNTNKATL
jgi:hypothetical protein